jgi:hypothetical protein
MDAAAAAAAGEWITAAGVFDGVVNLAAKSLIATDISGEVTFHRLLDTTPQDFLMLPPRTYE